MTNAIIWLINIVLIPTVFSILGSLLFLILLSPDKVAAASILKTLYRVINFKKIFVYMSVLIVIGCFILFGFSFLIQSELYQQIIFREIARNNNAYGDLSLIVLAFLFFLFILLGMRKINFNLSNIKNFLEIKKYIIIIIIIMSFVVMTESTVRRFYIRDMVAYYNQLLNIAKAKNLSNNVEIIFNAKLAQINTKEQFYAIEKALIEEIIGKKFKDENFINGNFVKEYENILPQRLRRKINIGNWHPLDWFLRSFYKRSVDEDFYNQIKNI